MSDVFTVPVAHDQELGTSIAANLSSDSQLLEQLRQTEVRGELRCAEAAPTLLLDVTHAGALRVVAGHLKQVIFHLSDIPSEPDPGPGEDNPVVVDSYDADPEWLPAWIRPWMRGSGLLTDPPEGRHGYAWVSRRRTRRSTPTCPSWSTRIGPTPGGSRKNGRAMLPTRWLAVASSNGNPSGPSTPY